MASYRMTVGDIENIPMGKTSVKTTFDSNEDFSVVMLSVIYKKKIFAPSEIYTKLSILPVGSNTIPSVSILQSKFSNKLVKLELEITNKDSTKSYETVAENFFVFKMKPSFIKDASGVTVELFIYSMDKLLTIDKYCNAFTARKLGDVFLDELSKFSVSGKEVQGCQELQILKYLDTSNEKMKEVRQPYMIQYNETFYDFLARYASRCGEFLYFENGQLHLGMEPNLATASSDQSSEAQSINYEDCMDKLLSLKYRHYNFFNYSSTDDNRYVDSTFEVLGKYQDEDTLTTGSKESGSVTEKTTKTYEKGSLVKTVVTTYYTEKEEKTEDQELAGNPKSEVTTITHQDSDGNKLIEETETVTYHYEYDSTEKKYKKNGGDYLYHTTTNSSKEYLAVQGVYNQPEPNDGNFEELEKDGYTDFKTEWWDWRLAGFQGIFLKIFNNTSLYDILSDMAWSLAQSAKDTKVDVEKKNDRNNDKNLTLTTSDNPDQTDGTTFSLFSTLKSQITNNNLAVNKTGDEVSLLVADFYAKMQMAAAVVSRVVVRLNYGENHQSLKLGDVIKVNGEYYIVKQIEVIVKPKDNSGEDLNASSNNNSNDSSNNSSNDNSSNSSSDSSDDKSIVDSYAVEAIPLFYTELGKDTDNKDVIMKAIPCAPLMPEIPTIRTSEPQVAFVEKNLDPNRFGRVRVRYPWQVKDGDLSPWIRMATPFATAGGGVTFRPYPGDEVLLNYEDGNIERPYIVGSLQSKYVTDPWLPLPDRVIRTKNGHSITFTDGDDGANFLWGLLPGSSFIKSCIPIYQPLITDQNMVDLTGGIKIHDRYGLYEIGMSSDKRSVTINSTLGTIKLNAFTGITISAPNGNIKIEGKNVSIAASNKLTLKSGTAVGEHWVPTSVGGLVKQFATDVLDRTVGMLIDFSFLRTLIEVFTRPVDGTLKIKSGSFVLIEAGKGEAKVSPADYRHPSFDKPKSPREFAVRGIMFGRLKNSIDLLTSKVETLLENIKKAHEALVDVTNYYKEELNLFNVDLYAKLGKMKLDGENDIISYVFENKSKIPHDFINDTIFGFEEVTEFKLPPKQTPKQEPEEDSKAYEERVKQYDFDYTFDNTTPLTRRAVVVNKAIEVAQNLILLFKAVDAWKEFEFTKQQKMKCYTSDNLQTAFRSLDITDSFIDHVSKGNVDLKYNWLTIDKEKTILKRKIVYELIKDAKDADHYKYVFGVKGIEEPEDYFNNDHWKTFADKIGDSTANVGKLAALGIDVIDFTRNYFMDKRASEWMDTFFNIRNKWKAEDTGKVLISDKAGQTICFDDGVSTLYDNYGTGNSAYPLDLRKKVSGVK